MSDTNRRPGQDPAAPASARQRKLLDGCYRYVLEHGWTDLSLRPLAQAVGSSPRVLLFLFGSKEGLVRALLRRAREDETERLARLESGSTATTIQAAVLEVWSWLAAAEHRGLLRLWLEGYSRSLVESDGPWRDFAAQTVQDWLELLGRFQPENTRHTEEATVERSYFLAVLRGALLDLLATDDEGRTGAAVRLSSGTSPALTSVSDLVAAAGREGGRRS